MRITLSLALTLLITAPAHAALLHGDIDGLGESSGSFFWGDGVNDLYHEWSITQPGRSGWFYPASYLWSNADVYVYSGLQDVRSVTDASGFHFATDAAQNAAEGDTVFFRGENGYYGAWVIVDIVNTGPNRNDNYLYGTWYFQSDGSANFSAVPLPAGGWLLMSCLGVLAASRRLRSTG